MKKISFVFFAILVLVGCQSKPVAAERVNSGGGSYQNVTPKELQGMLNDKDFVLVNVHIPFAGDIPSTDLSIPYHEIQENLAQLPADKSAKIVLYCRSGRMSEIAAEKLVSLGYTDVWNLEGGMVEWEQIGLELKK